jgi:hypothetical protein
MKVMAFDLSSKCIGVCTAKINDNTRQVEKIMSCPIIPQKFSPSVLGYANSKKKLPIKSGEMINTYYIPGEATITKSEKESRDKKVRAKKDIYVLEEIGKTMGNMINQIKPDLILVEKNAVYNGILTSILLAKVMGTLLGIAGMLGIPVQEYPVPTVRSHYNIGSLVKQFTLNKKAEELQTIPDITKRALRELLQKKYGHLGIVFQTDDESDACVVFDYWFENVY